MRYARQGAHTFRYFLIGTSFRFLFILCGILAMLLFEVLHINNKSNLCFGLLLRFSAKIFLCVLNTFLYLLLLSVSFCKWMHFGIASAPSGYSLIISLTFAVSVLFANRLLWSCAGFLLSLTAISSRFVAIFSDSSEGF